MFKKIILSLIIIGSIAACSKKESSNTLKVGTIDGPDVRLLEVTQQEAQKRYGLKIKIIPFSDYGMPNAALNDGSIDANVFQTNQFLDAQVKDHGYKIIPVAKTFVFPMGIYSKKIKTLSELPVGAKVAIPNDPSNGARALLLLQKANLIKLKPDLKSHAIPHDIIDNPRKLKFIELDAAQLPRALGDVDLAAINTNYAFPAGLTPKRNSLFAEDSHSNYENIIVTNEKNSKDPKMAKKIAQLIAAYHSQPVTDEAEKLFGNSAIPAWK